MIDDDIELHSRYIELICMSVSCLCVLVFVVLQMIVVYVEMLLIRHFIQLGIWNIYDRVELISTLFNHINSIVRMQFESTWIPVNTFSLHGEHTKRKSNRLIYTAHFQIFIEKTMHFFQTVFHQNNSIWITLFGMN